MRATSRRGHLARLSCHLEDGGGALQQLQRQRAAVPSTRRPSSSRSGRTCRGERRDAGDAGPARGALRNAARGTTVAGGRGSRSGARCVARGTTRCHRRAQEVAALASNVPGFANLLGVAYDKRDDDDAIEESRSRYASLPATRCTLESGLALYERGRDAEAEAPATCRRRRQRQPVAQSVLSQIEARSGAR